MLEIKKISNTIDIEDTIKNQNLNLEKQNESLISKQTKQNN